MEYRDRLLRCGADYGEAAMAASGGTRAVVDEAEMTDDLVQDMIDVMMNFYATLYGRRTAGRRVPASVSALCRVGAARYRSAG